MKRKLSRDLNAAFQTMAANRSRSRAEVIRGHLTEAGWVFISIYDGSDGRQVEKYFHPQGGLLLLEKFSPRGREEAIEVYILAERSNSLPKTLEAIHALTHPHAGGTDGTD